MRNKIYSLVAFMAATLALTGCMKNEELDNKDAYNGTAIVSFTIDKVKVARDTVNSAGKDTTIWVSYKAKNHKFYIDQLNGTIYNPDSLPCGTKVNAMLVKLVTKRHEMITIKALEDATEKEVVKDDSIDFSKPRTVYVYSENHQFHRAYTITVNVHKQVGNHFAWKALNTSAELATLEDTKAFSFNGNIYVFGKKGTQTIGYYTKEKDGNNWTKLSQAFSVDAYKNIALRKNEIFILDNGQIKRSTDGQAWQTMGTAALKQLVAASRIELFALSTNNTLMNSKDNGQTWTSEELDDDATKLPVSNINSITLPMTTNPGIDRVLLVGTAANASFATTWAKLSDSERPNDVYKWSFNNSGASSTFSLPNYNHLTIVNYNNQILGLGLANGKFAQMMESNDGGIIWKRNLPYTYPTGTPAATFAATVDGQQYVWIISGGQVWKGKLNSMNWTQNQTSYGN